MNDSLLYLEYKAFLTHEIWSISVRLILCLEWDYMMMLSQESWKIFKIVGGLCTSNSGSFICSEYCSQKLKIRQPLFKKRKILRIFQKVSVKSTGNRGVLRLTLHAVTTYKCKELWESLLCKLLYGLLETGEFGKSKGL